MGHKKPVRIDPLERALPNTGVDSHAHLDSSQFDMDRPEVIHRAQQAGLAQICNVFLGPQDYMAHREYFADYPDIFYIMGIHPCDGLKCTPQCLDDMQKYFSSDARLRAIGEIGLDFHWDDCPKELQMRAFAMQMELAKKIGLPVVIHCREAEAECLALLEGGGFSGYPLLWHCFGGDSALAARIVRNGWYISVPGPVTYPANTSLREAVKKIPEERLLLETDCPYLSPVPWRGVRNEPSYIVFTAHAVAEARGMPADELWQICGNNSRHFFGIDQTANKV